MSMVQQALVMTSKKSRSEQSMLPHPCELLLRFFFCFAVNAGGQTSDHCAELIEEGVSLATALVSGLLLLLAHRAQHEIRQAISIPIRQRPVGGIVQMRLRFTSGQYKALGRDRRQQRKSSGAGLPPPEPLAILTRSLATPLARWAVPLSPSPLDLAAAAHLALWLTSGT